jgi:hypothetical protein
VPVELVVAYTAAATLRRWLWQRRLLPRLRPRHRLPCSPVARRLLSPDPCIDALSRLAAPAPTAAFATPAAAHDAPSVSAFTVSALIATTTVPAAAVATANASTTVTLATPTTLVPVAVCTVASATATAAPPPLRRVPPRPARLHTATRARRRTPTHSSRFRWCAAPNSAQSLSTWRQSYGQPRSSACTLR